MNETQLKFAKSQIRIRHAAEFLLSRGFLLLFFISLDRAAFWSCSFSQVRCAASLLCLSLKIFHLGGGEPKCFFFCFGLKD